MREYGRATHFICLTKLKTLVKEVVQFKSLLHNAVVTV